MGSSGFGETKPKDLTFAEYLGVIVKDVYLEEMGD
jgi:hypothetical protein